RHREEGDDGLAASDVTLEQAKHPLSAGQIARKLRKRLTLGSRELERQNCLRSLPQSSAGRERARRLPSLPGAYDGQCKLARHQLVEGEPHPGRALGKEIIRGVRGMPPRKRLSPGWPPPAAPDRTIDPLGQLRCPIYGGH